MDSERKRLVDVRYVEAQNYPDVKREQYVIHVCGVPMLTSTANSAVDYLAEAANEELDKAIATKLQDVLAEKLRPLVTEWRAEVVRLVSLKEDSATSRSEGVEDCADDLKKMIHTGDSQDAPQCPRCESIDTFVWNHVYHACRKCQHLFIPGIAELPPKCPKCGKEGLLICHDCWIPLPMTPVEKAEQPLTVEQQEWLVQNGRVEPSAPLSDFAAHVSMEIVKSVSDRAPWLRLNLLKKKADELANERVTREMVHAEAEKMDGTQIIYTQIAHGLQCSGCANISYEPGDIKVSVKCNQCGIDMLSVLAVPKEVMASGAPEELKECCRAAWGLGVITEHKKVAALERERDALQAQLQQKVVLSVAVCGTCRKQPPCEHIRWAEPGEGETTKT